MDDDNAELINLLITRIGTIMEDTSVIVLTLGSLGSDERLARIQQLKRASASIATLAAAVDALI